MGFRISRTGTPGFRISHTGTPGLRIGVFLCVFACFGAPGRVSGHGILKPVGFRIPRTETHGFRISRTGTPGFRISCTETPGFRIGVSCVFACFGAPGRVSGHGILKPVGFRIPWF
jgi:hypothetical protein